VDRERVSVARVHIGTSNNCKRATCFQAIADWWAAGDRLQPEALD